MTSAPKREERAVCLGLVAGLVGFLAIGFLWLGPTLGRRDSGQTDNPSIPLSDPRLRLRQEEGHAFVIDLTGLGWEKFADDRTGGQSPVWIHENDAPLVRQPLPRSIRTLGKGRFGYLGKSLLFATSDNTDPSSNGRTYKLVFRRELLWRIDTTAAAWNVLRALIPIHILLFLALVLRFPRANLRWYRVALIGILALLCLCREARRWDLFSLDLDSASYLPPWTLHSLRPPVYPLLIGTSTSVRPLAISQNAYPFGPLIFDRPGDPLLRPVRAQKVILYGSLLILCWTLMQHLSPPLIGLACVWFLQKGGLSAQIECILTEPLAQAWAFLLAATFIHFLWKGSRWALPAMGLLFGALYLTRPAGIYAAVLPGIGSLWATRKDWRRFAPWVAMGGAAIALSVIWPPLALRLTAGHLEASPTLPNIRCSFGLQVAEPGDLDLMPDEESREFFRRAFVEKPRWDGDVAGSRDPSQVRAYEYLNRNLYRVCLPVATAMNKSGGSTMELFNKVSAPILSAHRGRLASLIEGTFLATGEVTRLKSSRFSFWVFGVIYIALALLVRGRAGLAATVLLLAHLAHLVVVSLFDTPLARYVYATEPLVLLGSLLLVAGLVDRLAPVLKVPAGPAV